MSSAQVSPKGFAPRFMRLREEAGLTKTALARPRYTVSHVSQIEAGRRKPSPQALEFFAERLGVTEDYLATGVPEGAAERIAYELEQARIALSTGRAQDAYEVLRPALGRAEEYGLTELRARILGVAAGALMRLGRVREAIDRYEEALEEGLLDRQRGMATAGLADAYRTVGDLAYAADLIESFFRAQGQDPLDPSVVAELHTVLLSIYFERGDMLRAERAAKRALAAAEQGVSPVVRANVLWTASRVLAEAKRWDDALELATRARVIIEDLHDHRRLALVHSAYAFLCLEVDPPRVAEAARQLDEAERLLGPDAPPGDLAHVYEERSRLALLLDDPDRALADSERALVQSADDPLQRSRGLFLRGRALTKLRRQEAALECFQEAAATFQKLGARQQEASCWREVGEIQLQAGDPDAAIDSLRSGLDALDPKRSRP